MRNKRNILFHFIELILILGFIFFVARLSVIHGPSMEGTLWDGDIVVVWQLGYEAKQGDVVIVNKKNPMNTYLTKRVVAVGGQHIATEDGCIAVNGVRLQEPYVPAGTQDFMLPDQEVPAGSVFILGDNRNHSTDSRDFGYIPETSVLGKVVWRIWPIGRISAIE